MLNKTKLILICALVLSLCMLAPLSSFAASASVEGPAEASPYEVLGFTVSLPEAVNVKSGSIHINFDSEFFYIGSAEWLGETTPTVLAFDPNYANGAFAYETPVYVSGPVLYVEIITFGSVAYGETSITFELQLKDADQQDIEISDVKVDTYVGCGNHSFFYLVDEDTFKSEANCQSPAIYYESCEHCGILGEGPFEHGDVGEHSLSEAWQYDETNHWHGCANCSDANKDVEEHSFGDWSVTVEPTMDSDGEKSATCSTCGYTKTKTLKYKDFIKETEGEENEETPAKTTATATEVAVSSGCGSTLAISALVMIPTLVGGTALIKRRKD